VDWDHYVLRVGLKFINSSQKTVVVTMIRAFLENKELEYLGTTAGKGNILTSKGWRILDQPRQESIPFPLLVPARNAKENQFVLFRVPDLTERGPSCKVRIVPSIAWHIRSSVLFDIKPESVLPPSDSQR
jgi:hypothetical protein